jgi:hypothetical protein
MSQAGKGEPHQSHIHTCGLLAASISRFLSVIEKFF